MDAYESFRNQIIQNKLGELRTREKSEFFVKVKEAAYRDEIKALSSRSMEGIVPRLVKTARLRQAMDVLSKDVNQSTSGRGEDNE